MLLNCISSDGQDKLVSKIGISEFEKTLNPDMGYDTLISRYGKPDIITGSGIYILIYNFADTASLTIGCHNKGILYAIFQDEDGIKHDLIPRPSIERKTKTKKSRKPKHNTKLNPMQ